jgi:hypothetical protein
MLECSSTTPSTSDPYMFHVFAGLFNLTTDVRSIVLKYIVGLFYWLHSVDKNTVISMTSYFQKIYCRISLRRKGPDERNIQETLQLNKVGFLCRSPERPEETSERQPQKVRVRYLFGRPNERKPPRALVCNMSRRPSERKPPRASVCKDI